MILAKRQRPTNGHDEVVVSRRHMDESCETHSNVGKIATLRDSNVGRIAML